MKKKVMSKEALEAIHAGKKPTEKPPTEPNAEGNLEPEGNEEVKIEPKEGEEVNFEEKFAALSGEFDALKENSDKKLSEAGVKLTESAAALETFGTSIAALKEIVAGTLEGMRTALDLAEVNVSDMDAETLVTEFKATEGKFLKSLPSGPVVPEASGNAEEKETKVINTIEDASAYESLGLDQ